MYNDSVMAEKRTQFWQKFYPSTGPKTTSIYKSPTMVSSPKPRLFALIIGINLYKNIRSLRAAVRDALAFKEYLEVSLAVPKPQISTLINKSATRAAIIQAFTELEKDVRIQKGDPIVIFFAGHGSEILAGSDTVMQVLVPQDYCEGPESVPGIPDRTIGTLLTKIAEAKGDNITVIFDCCHSASGTRGNEDVRVRSVELEPGIHTQELDRDIGDVTSRGASITPGFSHSGLRSHVLIAACSSSESSMESPEHGNFSSAFLKLLRSVSPNEIKYSDILTRMDFIPGQNPQCEGVHRSRLMFDAKVSKPSRFCFTVTLEETQLVLNAGAAHGIAPGAEFKVYRNDNSILTEEPLGILVVDTLQTFSSNVKILPGSTTFLLSQPAVAVQSKTGEREDIRLYIPLHDSMRVCYDAWDLIIQDGLSVALADTPQDAHLELALEGNEVVFLFKDERITQYGFNRVYFGAEPTVDGLVPVLKAVAHYYWKLNLVNKNSTVTSSIQMEFYKLEASPFNFDETGMPEMTPVGPNMCANNVIDFVVEEDSPYGLKLTNNTTHDLYPHLFYFDNSDLSIGEYYQPAGSSGNYKLDVPLRANGGILTIGYGAGGFSPFSYFLRQGQNVDVGFLKLFVSTVPINLSNIPQKSPFENHRGGSDTSKDLQETWGTMLLPVIQRRYPATAEIHPLSGGFSTDASLEIQRNTIRDLEGQNKTLKQEIEVLHESYEAATSEKRRLEKEASDLRKRVEELEKKAAAHNHVDNGNPEAGTLGNGSYHPDPAQGQTTTVEVPQAEARQTPAKRTRRFFGLWA